MLGFSYVDHTVALSDLDATPRRDVVSIWLWLNDVPPGRAAMRIAPGSHRILGEHWERMKEDWKQGKPLPVPPNDGTGTGEARQREADLSPFAAIEPWAVVANRGDVWFSRSHWYEATAIDCIYMPARLIDLSLVAGTRWLAQRRRGAAQGHLQHHLPTGRCRWPSAPGLRQSRLARSAATQPMQVHKQSSPQSSPQSTQLALQGCF